LSKLLRAVGLMSGTSMDGIDVAVIETDGVDAVVRGRSATFAYDAAFRARLAEAIEDARGLADRRARPGCLDEVERRLTEQHEVAVARFLAEHGLKPADVAVIGFHGQTVLHAPERRLTVQIGDGAALARGSGIDVVWDLRAADVAAGGQGAPLAPVYHRAMTARLPERPAAVVNIGGVGNVTWVGRDGTLLAFDTGPGNALIDDWMLRHTGQAVDAQGATAAGGKVDEEALNALLMNPYFGQVPPKSLDRNAFAIDPVLRLSVPDGAATLTAFTAASLARAREHFPEQPQLWVICGGGRRNRTLMSMLAAEVESAVVPAEALGFDGDSVEAEAWAYMAVRSLKGLPITFPGTTGVSALLSGGVLAKA
jgi:anhydro-N-acetylmuramic acid kinase